MLQMWHPHLGVRLRVEHAQHRGDRGCSFSCSRLCVSFNAVNDGDSFAGSLITGLISTDLALNKTLKYCTVMLPCISKILYCLWFGKISDFHINTKSTKWSRESGAYPMGKALTNLCSHTAQCLCHPLFLLNQLFLNSFCHCLNFSS